MPAYLPSAILCPLDYSHDSAITHIITKAVKRLVCKMLLTSIASSAAAITS